MGTLLNNIVTVKETKIQILKHQSNICVNGGERHQMAGLSGLFNRFYPKIMGITTSSLTSSFILVLVHVLFYPDFTLSDELEKGLLVHIYLLGILDF